MRVPKVMIITNVLQESVAVRAISGRAGGLRGPANAAAKRQRMLALWVRWLFAELVVPLLRAHFYVTESEAHRQRVFYYRQALAQL